MRIPPSDELSRTQSLARVVRKGRKLGEKRLESYFVAMRFTEPQCEISLTRPEFRQHQGNEFIDALH